MIIEFLKKLLQIILSKKNLNEAPNEWWQTILALAFFILIIISGPKGPPPVATGENKTVQKPVGKEQQQGRKKIHISLQNTEMGANLEELIRLIRLLEKAKAEKHILRPWILKLE